MKTVSIFVDVQNIYYTTKQEYQKNFDYNAFWAKATKGRKVTQAFAYATSRNDPKQKQFQNILRGIGFEVDEDKKGRPWIGHGGGSIGGTSMLIIYPEQELVVVVLVNQSNASVRNIAFSIADHFLNE